MEKHKTVEVISASTAEDQVWIRDVWMQEWGGETMISKGQEHHLRDLKSVVAWENGVRVGAATYSFSAEGCELISINATDGGSGIGSALLSAVEGVARQAGMWRVWLITSNDNLDALRFYQRRGYRIIAVYPNAIDEARKRKPSIPQLGEYDILVRDEIELEKRC